MSRSTIKAKNRRRNAMMNKGQKVEGDLFFLYFAVNGRYIKKKRSIDVL
jgi:hypothetical protein